jgi:hypothetical protein
MEFSKEVSQNENRLNWDLFSTDIRCASNDYEVDLNCSTEKPKLIVVQVIRKLIYFVLIIQNSYDCLRVPRTEFDSRRGKEFF